VVILSLDSNVVADAVRGAKPHVRVHMEGALAKGATLKLCTVALHELMFGAHLSPRPVHHLGLLDRFLTAVEVEPWTGEDAAETARLRADLEKKGVRIGAYDTLIAGQALNRGWTMVTANTREFGRVQGLDLLDWSDPSGPIDPRAALARSLRPPEE
jgi:tRNA(fMet)-specific endonuclease VapC